jgi:hypothetical protein
MPTVVDLVVQRADGYLKGSVVNLCKHFMRRFFALMSSLLLATFVLVVCAAPALANEYTSTAPADAEVYLIAPVDGANVSSPFTVQFGLSGMGIAPVGVDRPKTGHHHLLVDLETLPDLDKALSATEHIKHFGGGQTEL